MNPAQTLALAYEHHRARRLAEAARLYQQILASFPNDVGALHGLGYALYQSGNPGGAEPIIRKAIELNPQSPDFHFSLAEVLHAQDRDDQAVVELYEVVKLKPDHTAAWTNLGIALHKLGRALEAAEACRRSLQIDPNNADVHSQHAAVLLALSHFRDAADAARKALQINPGLGAASNNLGEALRGLDRPDEASTHYRRAIESSAQVAHYAHNNLGITAMMQGRIEESIAQHRRSMELKPDHIAAHDNLLHVLHYSPRATVAEIAAEHRGWAEKIEASVTPRTNHAINRDPNRRLRVGYVSSDFRKHAIEHFIEPILAHHDRTSYEVTCYSNTLWKDATTERLRGLADRWRDVHALSDDAFADQVVADEIDILIDLSAHSLGHRLPVFARKPAPVQMTYLGYPGTTGLRAVDYRITAAGMDLPGVNEGPEQLLSLPDCYFCYQPIQQSPEVGRSPSTSSGFVTFGSFNRLSKINPDVIEAWSKILAAVPGSKLQLLAIGLVEQATRRKVTEQFAAYGVPANRLILKPPMDQAGYLAAHHAIDIALDPFPFNGGTTTLHALWMGVPVVTLAGKLPVGRMGYSTLTAAGLKNLVAESVEDYVEIAVQLASDAARCAALRAGMRQRLRSSPLMQHKAFTQNLESLYRKAWSGYCNHLGAR